MSLWHDGPALARGVGGTVGSVCEWVNVYGMLSVLSTQFCSEPKKSLKNKVCFIKKSKQQKKTICYFGISTYVSEIEKI